MRIILLILGMCTLVSSAIGQDRQIADLDGDAISDTVYIDPVASTIVCRLSTQNFKKLASKPIDVLNEQAGLSLTRNGFEFFNNFMRAGYKNQFRYDTKAKKIQLIGMSRYEFGPATNDGSGESSVNLLTNHYIGNWSYHDERREKLVTLPTITATIDLGKIYLEDFSDEICFEFAKRCSALYNTAKKRALAASARTK